MIFLNRFLAKQRRKLEESNRLDEQSQIDVGQGGSGGQAVSLDMANSIIAEDLELGEVNVQTTHNVDVTKPLGKVTRIIVQVPVRSKSTGVRCVEPSDIAYYVDFATGEILDVTCGGQFGPTPDFS